MPMALVAYRAVNVGSLLSGGGQFLRVAGPPYVPTRVEGTAGWALGTLYVLTEWCAAATGVGSPCVPVSAHNGARNCTEFSGMRGHCPMDSKALDCVHVRARKWRANYSPRSNHSHAHYHSKIHKYIHSGTVYCFSHVYSVFDQI